MLCALRRDDGDAWSEHRHLDGEGARLTLSREPDAPQLATARRSVCASNAAALLIFDRRLAGAPSWAIQAIDNLAHNGASLFLRVKKETLYAHLHLRVD